MRQRAILAMALITSPPLIVLDEPTSALDMLTQANIFNALKDIKHQLEVGYILITHDISTSSDLADEVVIMYAGQIVEHSYADTGYRNPSTPTPGASWRASRPCVRTRSSSSSPASRRASSTPRRGAGSPPAAPSGLTAATASPRWLPWARGGNS